MREVLPNNNLLVNIDLYLITYVQIYTVLENNILAKNCQKLLPDKITAKSTLSKYNIVSNTNVILNELKINLIW